ncbi:MAG: hypothetical protein O3B03_06260 [Proteobacteria bacterium]|nr:hypothetical protein [Pseudomonadota bacterium]MDA1331873.1 hypothetical protein [Pseudomonadota bacterium]
MRNLFIIPLLVLSLTPLSSWSESIDGLVVRDGLFTRDPLTLLSLTSLTTSLLMGQSRTASKNILGLFNGKIEGYGTKLYQLFKGTASL